MTTITISNNHWLIPSAERAFEGWLEGSPTEEERKLIIDAAVAARESWKPSAEALQLVEQLRGFVGSRIRIQFWDSCMWLLEDEGPFPVDGNCTDILLLEEDGFPQAFIKLSDIKEIPTADGYSPFAYLKPVEGGQWLASLADLYKISKV